MWQMVSQKVLHGHQRVVFRFEILLWKKNNGWVNKVLAQGVAGCMFGSSSNSQDKSLSWLFINLAGKRKEWRQYRDISKKWDILFIMTKTKWIHKKKLSSAAVSVWCQDIRVSSLCWRKKVLLLLNLPDWAVIKHSWLGTIALPVVIWAAALDCATEPATLNAELLLLVIIIAVVSQSASAAERYEFTRIHWNLAFPHCSRSILQT